MLESAFAMLLHHAPTQYPARAARQWIPPSIPPEQLASGSRRVSRQSCSPVDPAQYLATPVDPAEYPARAARQWIPPSIPPKRLASGSHRVSRQSGSPVGPAEYPARAAGQWIPVSRQSCSPAESAQYPPRAARQWIPPIPPERLGSGFRQVSHHSPPVNPAESAEYPRLARRWIPRVSRQSTSPVDPAEYPTRAVEQCPARAAASGSRRVSCSVSFAAEYLASIKPERLASIRQWIPPVPRQSSSPVWFCLINAPPGTQLGLHFTLVPSCFECTLRLGEGDAVVLLWPVNKQLRLIPRRVSFWKGLGFC